MNAIGRGRVDGAQASANGLIDAGRFGAINAKTAVGIAQEEKVELVFYPRRRNLIERLGQPLGARVFGNPSPWWQQLRNAAGAWRSRLLHPTLMPQDVSIQGGSLRRARWRSA